MASSRSTRLSLHSLSDDGRHVTRLHVVVAVCRLLSIATSSLGDGTEASVRSASAHSTITNTCSLSVYSDKIYTQHGLGRPSTAGRTRTRLPVAEKPSRTCGQSICCSSVWRTGPARRRECKLLIIVSVVDQLQVVFRDPELRTGTSAAI